MRFKEHRWFLLIFFLSALLRFYPLSAYQFTFDELSGLDRTQFASIGELIEKGVRVDAHPALVQVLLYFLVKIFGFSTWLIKLPFLLLGQAAIIYAYRFGLRHFSKQSGLVAATFFSFSLIFVYYAPIARMYISGVFFSLGLLYHFYEITFRRNASFRQFFLFAVFAWLCALNHHISALFALTVCLSAFFIIEKKLLKPYLLSCLVVVICYLPHLGTTLYQLSVPGIGTDSGGWLGTPRFTDLYDFLKVLSGTGMCWVMILALLAIAVFYGGTGMRPHSFLLLLLFCVNFLVIYLYSVLRSPIFQYSVMLFAGSAFLLWLSANLDAGHLILNRIILLMLIVLLIQQSYLQKNYYRNAVQTVYEYQFARTLEHKKRYGDSEVYPIFFDCDTLMRKIYFNKYNCRFDFMMSSDTVVSYGNRMYYNNRSSVLLFSGFIQKLKVNFLAVSSAPPFYQELIQQEFPYLIENTQTQAVDYKLYSRLPGKQAAPDRVVFSCEVPQPCGMEYLGGLPFHADSLNEFPFTVRMPYQLAVKSEGQTVLVKSRIRIRQPAGRNLEMIISTNDKITQANYYYSGRTCNDFMMQKDSVMTIIADQYAGRSFADIHKRARLSAYLWNRGRQNFEILSFAVKTVDYWPMKWHWWD